MRYCGRREDGRAMCSRISGTASRARTPKTPWKMSFHGSLSLCCEENERINPQNQDEKREGKQCGQKRQLRKKAFNV